MICSSLGSSPLATFIVYLWFRHLHHFLVENKRFSNRRNDRQVKNDPSGSKRMNSNLSCLSEASVCEISRSASHSHSLIKNSLLQQLLL